MYCHKCGTKNDDGSIYCHSCGENLSFNDIPLLDISSSSQSEDLIPEQSDIISSNIKTSEIKTPNKKGSMRFSTRVAYNILRSDRTTTAIIMLFLAVIAACIVAIASCLGLASSFAALSNARSALRSGIINEAIQKGIADAQRRVLSNLIAIPISLLVFFWAVRLLVRIRRVSETLKAVRREFK